MEYTARLNKKAENIKSFKSTLIKFLIFKERSLFPIHDITGVELLTRLSHLNE